MRQIFDFVSAGKFRLYFYSVMVAAFGLLVYYGIVEAEAVPYWLTLIGALGMISNGTAATKLNGQLKRGEVE